MRILIVTDTFPPDINGVARTLNTLGEGLERRGHTVQVVTTVEAADATGLQRQVMHSMPLPGYPGLRFGFASLRQMLEVFDDFRPEVLYVATEGLMGIASIRAAGKRGIPVVSGFHTNFQTYLEDYNLPGLEPLAQGILRGIHNQTARTLTPSTDTAHMLERWGIQNVGVLGRGVDTDLFDPQRRSTALRQSWGADDATPVAIYVGRIAAEKNLELAVRAFAAFHQVQPEARMVFVGDGPRLAALQEEHPEFHYAGSRTGEDLAAHYASGDVFLFPSTTETFGNVVLEALSSGLGVVAFDYAAPRLLIRSGENGWVAPLADEPAFLHQVRVAAAAWNDRALRFAARQTAFDLGWARVIEQFEQELATVMQSPSPLKP
ncbi:glycosyltransferase family 1 protein [Prosthecobacter sp.]|uniref:glycosyltransferase family 4 protein n=1 Tax=Prosthecobacter sp. TaxID=1965333 RepID=UPI002ABC31C1|nr:glycosyltransferase family 1 protein [Prosthecobacter sp.]MDZ4405027.1 glycosyltransferase family 1 protein [Prosthecobacter sp.]